MQPRALSGSLPKGTAGFFAFYLINDFNNHIYWNIDKFVHTGDKWRSEQSKSSKNSVTIH
ncbi:hypothetical protein GCM10011352_03940 [Marinobacterium zhoushanense]|uniref:Uncharacterized protein n=1 Tax=Marinobacterium zhoushanense TaxID=1679163 RepID=A0ABQ1K2S2_9GAMM|nr:hypothetical protein GCM10011352_03940 [Marinobacterium zhoushanense]